MVNTVQTETALSMDLVHHSKGPDREQKDSAVMTNVILMWWHLGENWVQEEGSVSVAYAAMDYSRAESRKVLH